MKTTKEQTENFARFLLKSRVTGRVYLDRVRIAHLLDIIDDIDELEAHKNALLAECDWKEEMLERAKEVVKHARLTGRYDEVEVLWREDLEKGQVK